MLILGQKKQMELSGKNIQVFLGLHGMIQMVGIFQGLGM